MQRNCCRFVGVGKEKLRHFDYIIVGGGIIGLTIARELIKRVSK